MFPVETFPSKLDSISSRIQAICKKERISFLSKRDSAIKTLLSLQTLQTEGSHDTHWHCCLLSKFRQCEQHQNVKIVLIDTKINMVDIFTRNMKMATEDVNAVGVSCDMMDICGHRTSYRAARHQQRPDPELSASPARRGRVQDAGTGDAVPRRFLRGRSGQFRNGSSAEQVRARLWQGPCRRLPRRGTCR